MSITYWLSFEDMERCFTIYRKGTVFEKEPAYITAYEICKGLNELYASKDHLCIPLRDAQTGKLFIECPTADNIDKMIKWLREKHDIFYYQAMNLCIPLEDPLSRSVKKFWEEEDAQQKQIEEYCKNDPACGLSLKKMHNRYMNSYEPPTSGTDFKTRFDRFVEKVWEGVFDEEAPVATSVENKTARAEALYEKLVGLKKERDELKERDGKLACDYEALWIDREKKKRMLNSFYGATCGATADAYGEVQRLKKENQTLMQQVDSFSKITAEYKDEIGSLKRVISGLNIRVNNQSSIIKTQNDSLTKQRKQLKDLGVALGNVKEVVDCEMDDLMKTHGDDIIPVF